MLEPLDDGHVKLLIDDEPYEFTDYRGANRVIEENFPLQSEYDDIQDYANAMSAAYKEIRASYLDEGSSNSVDGAERDQILWGKIGGVVGYLRVASMSGLSDNSSDVQADIEAINEIMTVVMADLQNTNAMIIDVRSNGGGEDAVSLAIASYFTDQRRLAVSKFTRSVFGTTEPVEAYIDSVSETPYLNPVVILQAPDTASAAEVFLMAMASLPQVTLLGENSSGELSDIIMKTLPNGWEIGLSTEVYLDSVGVNHEVNGVTPSITASTFSLQAIEQGRDAALDTALETLGYPELSRN
jgi:C-terminal processing protease CtpA/Prc